MKKINLLFSLLLLVSVFQFSSCDKDDDLVVDDISGLGGDTWVPGAIDKWINDSLTTPFNIAATFCSTQNNSAIRIIAGAAYKSKKLWCIFLKENIEKPANAINHPTKINLACLFPRRERRKKMVI